MSFHKNPRGLHNIQIIISQGLTGVSYAGVLWMGIFKSNFQFFVFREEGGFRNFFEAGEGGRFFLLFFGMLSAIAIGSIGYS